MDISILNDAGELIGRYGPFAIFLLLLLPIGEEIIVVPAGVLIGLGQLDAWQTYLCAYFGAFFSDSIWYVICYRFGTPLLHKRWFKRLAHPRRLLQAKHQIEKRGAWLIVTARFIPGSRTSAMVAAGLLHMPAWKYALAEGAALLFTVSLQLGLGWLISRQIGTQGTAGVIMTVVGVVIVLVFAAFIWRWVLRHRKTECCAPRSKAAWLRHFRPSRAHRPAH